MWKKLSHLYGDPSYLANRREIAAVACVSAVAFCYWVLHLISMLFFISGGMSLLVAFNACGVVACFAAFYINRKGKHAPAVLLIMVDICLYCVITVVLLGWGSNAQWILPSAMLPCLLVFPVEKGRQRLYAAMVFASILACFLFSEIARPVYPGYRSWGVVLLHMVCSVVISVVSVWFKQMGSKVAEGYYEQRINHLSNDANVDSLTGLWNRRYVMEQVHRLVGDQRRTRFSVAMLDVDFFKNINDSYGHPFGDLVLQRLSERILHAFRQSDIAARWGGEEFLVILTGAESQEVMPKLEEFRKSVQHMVIADKGISVSITVTIGVSEYHTGMNINEVIRQSDVALYYGKRHGRNQVVQYSEIPLSELSKVNT